MNLGIIARADNSGLGIMSKQYIENLKINKILVISFANKKTDFNRFPNATYLPEDKLPSDDCIRSFLKDLDVLLTIEIPYNINTYKIAREMGVKTVLIPMVECTPMGIFKDADLYLCNSFMDYHECNSQRKVYIPYPVNTTELTFKKRRGNARTFVHIVGHGSFHGRNGTKETLEAFAKVNNPEIKLIIYNQIPVSLESAFPNINIEVRGSVENYVDLYKEGEVLLLPVKFGAMFLPIMEALASGMPVILNRRSEWEEWLVDDNFGVEIQKRYSVSIPTVGIPTVAVDPDVNDLAEKIKWCAQNDMAKYSEKAREWAEKNSWEILGKRIIETFRYLCDGNNRYTSPFVMSFDKVNEHYKAGMQFYEQSKIDEAIDSLWMASIINPQDATIPNNIGVMYYKEGKKRDALLEFERAIKLDPNYSEPHYNIAKVYADENDWGKTCIHATQCLEIDPVYMPAIELLENVDNSPDLNTYLSEEGKVALLVYPELGDNKADWRYYVKNLVLFGYKVEIFCYREEAKKNGIQGMNHALVQKAVSIKPNLIFITKGEIILPDAVKTIKRLIGAVVINWYFDQYGKCEDWIINLNRETDIYFQTTGWSEQLRSYIQHGVRRAYWLPQGIEPEVHKPATLNNDDNELYKSDVTFIGTYYDWAKEKIALFDSLSKTGCLFKIWGPKGWPLRFPYQGRPVYDNEFAKVCSASKIVININSTFSDIPFYLSDRYYLTLGTGVFSLVKYVPGLEKIFNNREHLVWFQTVDECIELIKHYLSHPEERRSIAKAGCEEVHKKHTYWHRIRHMLAIVSTIPTKVNVFGQ